MTNVRVMKSNINNKYVLDKKATAKRKERPPLTEEEIQGMFDKADTMEVKYFRLRAKAIVAIAKVFGKRVSEISSLKVDDLRVEKNLLVITFTLRKKRKRGLFQYLKYLKKQDADLDNKTHAELEAEWKQWQQTKEGIHVKNMKSQKGVKLTSPYAKIILEYWTYIKTKFKACVYLFPAGKSVFGEYSIDFDNHIGDRTLLNTIKFLNPNAWMHLFRELKGADVAKQYGRTLESVYQVKDALDLESEQTAYHYVKRFVVHEMNE